MSSSENEKSSIFTPNELDFLKSQRLCRIATVNAAGQPHVTPVAFRYNVDTDTFDIGGHGGFTQRKKWRDVQQNPQVAFVMDTIVSFNPWKVQGIEIRGTVELLSTGGESVVPGADPEMFHITPRRIVSWGLDTEAYSRPNSRAVNEASV
ncbi:MAG: PPOX class F420-dependent oxidoreductase [Chloroflexota bacterium]